MDQDSLCKPTRRPCRDNLRLGITGLSEANGIDMSGPVCLAEVDERMIQALMLKDYFRYLVLTVSGKGSGDCVRPA